MPEATVLAAVLTLEEAAEYLGCHPVTLRKTYKHEIPYIQHTVPNGRLFFEKRDLDVWLDKNKKRPA